MGGVESAPATPDARALLLRAAERAADQRSPKRALRVAWAWLHTEVAVQMQEAFRLWCASEGYGYHPSGLGAVVARRYGTSGEIAASLRRAAAGGAPSGEVSP